MRAAAPRLPRATAAGRTSTASGPAAPRPLSDRDVAAVAALVYEHSGITLHEGKRALIQARLHRRLRDTGARSIRDYLALVRDDATGQELGALLDAIATNHTSFFREPQHFDFLAQRVVPEWRTRGHEPLDVWSAACASGEEVYSLAITLADVLGEIERDRVRVLGSDISTKALAAAQAGVYRLEKVQNLPMAILRKHFERGLGEHTGWARVQPSLRRGVDFHRINLLSGPSSDRAFTAIFCRNVMIYFDRDARQRVIRMLEQRIRPGGYLFIAHSESLNGLTHSLCWVAPAVYQRRIA